MELHQWSKGREDTGMCGAKCGFRKFALPLFFIFVVMSNNVVHADAPVSPPAAGTAVQIQTYGVLPVMMMNLTHQPGRGICEIEHTPCHWVVWGSLCTGGRSNSVFQQSDYAHRYTEWRCECLLAARGFIFWLRQQHELQLCQCVCFVSVLERHG